jgi:hypothetical protein
MGRTEAGGKVIAHEYADAFPMATDGEIQQMAADIKERGLLNPIITLDGKILDGRNRARACEIADVTPDYTEYSGTDPLGDVVAWNLHRRQLSTSQRAEVARTLKPMYEEQAKARQAAAGGDRKSLMANLPQAIDGKGAARDQAAAAVGVSGRTVQDAEFVHQHAPELSEKIKAGEMTVNKAKEEVKKREAALKRPAVFNTEEEEEAFYEKAEKQEQKEVGQKQTETKNKPIPAPIEAALNRLETEIKIVSGSGWKRCDKCELIKRIKSILKGVE